MEHTSKFRILHKLIIAVNVDPNARGCHLERRFRFTNVQSYKLTAAMRPSCEVLACLLRYNATFVEVIQLSMRTMIKGYN